MGWILFQSRHYDEAIREVRSDLAVHRDDTSTYWSCWFLGFALIANDQPDGASAYLSVICGRFSRLGGAGPDETKAACSVAGLSRISTGPMKR